LRTQVPSKHKLLGRAVRMERPEGRGDLSGGDSFVPFPLPRRIRPTISSKPGDQRKDIDHYSPPRQVNRPVLSYSSLAANRPRPYQARVGRGASGVSLYDEFGRPDQMTQAGQPKNTRPFRGGKGAEPLSSFDRPPRSPPSQPIPGGKALRPKPQHGSLNQGAENRECEISAAQNASSSPTAHTLLSAPSYTASPQPTKETVHSGLRNFPSEAKLLRGIDTVASILPHIDIFKLETSKRSFSAPAVPTEWQLLAVELVGSIWEITTWKELIAILSHHFQRRIPRPRIMRATERTLAK
jgi:hypothetical protein